MKNIRYKLHLVRKEWNKFQYEFSPYWSTFFLLKIFLSKKFSFFSKKIKIYSNYFQSKIILRVQNNFDIRTYVNTVERQFHISEEPIQIREKDVIIDLGANIGLTALDFNIKYPDAVIYAVEMDQENFELARINCSNNKNIHLFNYAIWKENTLVNYDGSERQDGYMISNSMALNSALRTIRGITINKLFSDLKIVNVKYLKMDIEGAEKEIFFKSDLTWLEKVEAMNIELHDFREAEFEKLNLILTRLNFKIAKSKKHWSSIFAYKLT